MKNLSYFYRMTNPIESKTENDGDESRSSRSEKYVQACMTQFGVKQKYTGHRNARYNPIPYYSTVVTKYDYRLIISIDNIISIRVCLLPAVDRGTRSSFINVQSFFSYFFLYDIVMNMDSRTFCRESITFFSAKG